MSAPLASGNGDPSAAAPDQGAVNASTRSLGNILSFGLMDNAVAATNATIMPMINGDKYGKTWGERYGNLLAKERADTDAAAAQHPYASAAGDVAGIVAAAPRAGVQAAGAIATPLLTRVGKSAAVGGALGAAQGFGSGRGGFENRVASAVGGGAAGAATGGFLPLAGKAISWAGQPIVDAVAARVNPEGFAARKVVQRMEAGGRSVDEAAHRMAEAAANGDSLSLADVGGKQLQRLGRSVVNAGGPGGSQIMTRANLEAMGQGGRIGEKVSEGLGTPGLPYQDAKAAVMDARSKAAKPLYDLAYKTPVPYTFDLQEMLQTPAGKAGLAAAKRNSLNRREPWAQWFPNVADDGTITDFRRVPDTRALDEVKRVLDNMTEAAKRPADGSPFGKALATPESIAVQSVRDDLRNFLTTHNKPYAAAMAKGMDNIQADQAIEFGRDIFNTDPRIITRRMGLGGAGRDQAFNDGQRELVRIGAEDAIKQKLGNTNFTHNALLKFFSSRTALDRLRPLFRSPAEWQRFRTSMFNEARKRAKYDAIKSNSTTAAQLLDAQDAGQLGEMAQTAIHAAHSGPLAAAASMLSRSVRRLGGLTPQVGEQVAKLISTRDIGRVQAIVRQLDNVQRSRASSAQKLNAARNLLTRALAMTEGRALSPSQPPPSGGQ